MKPGDVVARPPQIEAPITPRLLGAKEAARYLSISVSMLREIRLPVLRIGRAVRWDVRDLDGFVEKLKAVA